MDKEMKENSAESDISLTKRGLDNYRMTFSGEYIKKNYPEHIPTGFKKLDKLLGGGLAPCLTVLGAISSLGKSTFALQVAQNISAWGRPVIYFSLEMSRHAVSMKSVQRCAFMKTKKELGKNLYNTGGIVSGTYNELKEKSISTADLLNSKSGKEALKKTALEECSKECKNLFIVERDYSNTDFSANNIADFVSEFIRVTGQKPVVFVDYLQILISSTDKAHKTEKQIVDENIQKLWLIANRNQIPVFVISSVNRDSYSKSISFSSFKESGGIEFTADIVLGMQFSALHGGAEGKTVFNPDEEKSRDPRRIEILVLKQRYGMSGTNAYDRFIYYPQFSCFEEGDYNVKNDNDDEQPKLIKTTGSKERRKERI